MTHPLHVGITVDPNLPVPPGLYGGIERIVDFLVRGLDTRGHRVTLFGHPASHTAAELVPYGIPPHQGPKARLGELAQLGSAIWSRRTRVDLIHSFGRMAALVPVLPYRGLPKLQSYQRDAVPWRSVRIATRVAGPSIEFSGCSGAVYADAPPDSGRWHTVFNGADLSKYDLVSRVAPDAPLVFLGRIERIKGTHSAIAIARGSGRDLIIAGNKANDPAGLAYFSQEVEPHLDGKSVQYVGPVDDVQKNALLGRAAALLMPIEWNEAFGIVMAEAMACGTPVIAFPRGSVPEVVRDGLNGYVVQDVSAGIAAVRRLGAIDRGAVRLDCEVRFSSDAIVTAYEQLYYSMIGRIRAAR